MFTPLLTIAILSLRPSPVAPALPVGDAGQWGAVAAVARVSSGRVGPVASAACVGLRGPDAYLLTAAHVVPPGGGREFEFFTRDSYPVPAWAGVGGEVVWRDAATDAALVRLPVGDYKPAVVPLAAAFNRPKSYPARLWAVGCPGGIAPACRAETVLGRPLISRPGNEAAFFWQTESAAAGGMSGGPLLDVNSRVVGVCAAASGGGGFYTHHDEILAGLKKAGYGWLIPPE